MGLSDNAELREWRELVYTFTNPWWMAYSMAWLRSQTCSFEKKLLM